MPGLRRGKQELAARTLTPLILVRIHVPQPCTSLTRFAVVIARKRTRGTALANPGSKIYRVLRERDMLTPEITGHRPGSH